MALNVYFRCIDATTLKVIEELRRYRYKSVNYWINPDCNPPKFIRDYKIIQHGQIDHQLICYFWNSQEAKATPMYDGLEHLASRYLSDKIQMVCIDSRAHPGNCIVLFQDAPHLDHYPQEFIKIPCFCSFDDLINYALSEKIFAFSLDNNNEYEKTHHMVQGESVYREKKTNRLWYLDNFHKNHYEVFDRNASHLGEADLEGNLDISKKDKNKTFSL